MPSKNQQLERWQLAYEPRDWQHIALNKWEQTFKGIVQVVTGGGKTVFSFLCILRYLKSNSNVKVLVIVPTLTLLDQWFISFQDELNVDKADIGIFSGEEKSKEFKAINIIVINTARKILPPLDDKENYFLIVDECHRAGSPLNSEAISGFTGPTLGLSATPEREYDDGLQSFIIPSLGPIIYRYDYKEALKDGVICKYELINVEVKLLAHEKVEYNKVTKKINLLSKQRIHTEESKQKINLLLIKRARISSTALMRLPVAGKIVEENIGERIIVFHESIEAIDTLFENLKKRDKSATIYHSHIGKILRRDNLRLYRSGRFNVLLTCKALDEGMNAPETTVAIIASSTSSIRQRIQRLGRVLRPSKGKDIAKIYTLYCTNQEKERLIDEYKQLEDEVKVTWFTTETTNGSNSS